MSKIYLLIFCIGYILIQNTQCYSQPDTLLMLNGNYILTTVIESNDQVTRCKHPKKTDKTIIIDNDKIFSITNSNGERVIYHFDTLVGNDLTIEEMRIYIIGEQDAQRGYKPRITTVGGVIIGAAAGITGSFLSPIIPFTYSALLGIPKIKVNKKSVSNPELLKQDVYLMGYQSVARGKRFMRSLISGGAGLVSGLVTYGILKKQGKEPF